MLTNKSEALIANDVRVTIFLQAFGVARDKMRQITVPYHVTSECLTKVEESNEQVDCDCTQGIAVDR